VKLFDETKTIAKSMQAVISVLKNSLKSPSEILKMFYASKLSLSYHKNLTVVERAVKFLQNIAGCSLSKEDCTLMTKLILSLLANADLDVQRTAYIECHALVKSILGVEYNRDKLSWENLTFLLEQNVLTEIISHGATSENSEVIESFYYTFLNVARLLDLFLF